MQKKSVALCIVLLLVFTCSITYAQSPAFPGALHNPKEVRNVILLLSDGTAPEAWPLIRWVKGAPLAVDTILTGAIRTYGADSIITDSAPGATAYATGFKGTDKGISVFPWNVTIEGMQADAALACTPLATLLEGAKLTGRKTGIVATSNVQHASPAAFTAHWHDRNNYNEIAEQQVYQEIDVVLSGGRQYLLPEAIPGGKRTDGANLVDVLMAKGYTYITTRDELMAVKTGRVWGAFAPDAMAYDIDRAKLAPDEPALAEMTTKAIELLAAASRGKPRGFFLFVEGSKVDWAAHANDTAGVVSDLLAFDAAVQAALNFARKDPQTLVIVVADHGTGGLTIGTRTDAAYSSTDDDEVTALLRKTKLTGESVAGEMNGDASEEHIRNVVAAEWGITDLAADELGSIQENILAGNSLPDIINPMLSRRARIGWTTGGHTGADVFLFAYGPGAPAGLCENTGIGRLMAARMGFNFTALNQRLFVEAGQEFTAAGFQVQMDNSDAANPVLVVSKETVMAQFPLSTNLLILNNKTIELEGIVVQAAKTGKVYLPRQAVRIVTTACN